MATIEKVEANGSEAGTAPWPDREGAMTIKKKIAKEHTAAKAEMKRFMTVLLGNASMGQHKGSLVIRQDDCFLDQNAVRI
ncbi:MAG: hypothetical protein NTU47_06995 [Ignavibacteriales bacterium]|nr:hypothetical protein [Ignavibacteriales bacterium]